MLYVSSLVEIGSVVLKKIFELKSATYFSYYLPLEKGGAFHLNKFEFSLHKGALCQVWLKLVQWFLRILDENVKKT